MVAQRDLEDTDYVTETTGSHRHAHDANSLFNRVQVTAARKLGHERTLLERKQHAPKNMHTLNSTAHVL